MKKHKNGKRMGGWPPAYEDRGVGAGAQRQMRLGLKRARQAGRGCNGNPFNTTVVSAQHAWNRRGVRPGRKAVNEERW